MSVARHLQALRRDAHRMLQQLTLLLEHGANPPFELQLAAGAPGAEQPAARSDAAVDGLAERFDGLLWGVQKNRRSVETRLRRKFGHSQFAPNAKMLRLRTDLTICAGCGSWHERAFICAVCYKRVKEETKLLQRRILEALQPGAVDREVEIAYRDEQPSQPDRLLVEVDRPRPAWFGPDLLARSAAELGQPPSSAPSEQPTLQAKIK